MLKWQPRECIALVFFLKCKNEFAKICGASTEIIAEVMTAERCVFCARTDQGKIGEFVSKNGCNAHVNCLVRALNGFMVC